MKIYLLRKSKKERLKCRQTERKTNWIANIWSTHIQFFGGILSVFCCCFTKLVHKIAPQKCNFYGSLIHFVYEFVVQFYGVYALCGQKENKENESREKKWKFDNLQFSIRKIIFLSLCYDWYVCSGAYVFLFLCVIVWQ